MPTSHSESPGKVARGHSVARRLLALSLASLLANLGARSIALAKHRRSQGDSWLSFEETIPKPVPTLGQEKNGFIVFRRSILERVYPNSHPRPQEIVSSVALQAAWDEYEPVQLAVYPLRDLHQVQVTVSDLRDDHQHVIPSSQVVVRMERFYGQRLALATHRFGVVPKTLEISQPIDLQKERVRPYWITAHVPDGQPGGEYTGTIRVRYAGGEATVGLAVEVIPAELKEPDIFYGVQCINAPAKVGKALARRGIDVAQALADSKGSASGAVGTALRRAEIEFEDQRDHGMNTVSPWSGRTYEERDGHPYLPDLEVAMALYKKYGFTKPLVYVPVNLLKTNKINRSASYREYDPKVDVPIAKKIAQYYTKRFRDEGMPGIVFIPVEEPNLKSGIGLMDPKDIRQRIARELTQAMKEAGATTAMTCTPQSVRSVEKYLDIWIVAYKRFTPKLYDMARQAHARLALYANATVMGQGTYFTRFMFGYFLWANGIEGMLPWTYPLQPNRFPKNLQNAGEGGLDVIDGFLGPDGKPIPTIQWELAREGIDDVRYLATIEALAPKVRQKGTPAALAAAGEAERLLSSLRASIGNDAHEYDFQNETTFEPQPEGGWNAEKFEAARRQSVEVLKKLLSVS